MKAYKKLIAGAILTTMASGLVTVVFTAYSDIQNLKADDKLIFQKQDMTDKYLYEIRQDVREIKGLLLKQRVRN